MTGCMSIPVSERQAVNIDVIANSCMTPDFPNESNAIMSTEIMSGLFGICQPEMDPKSSKRGLAVQRLGKVPTFEDFMTIIKEGTMPEIRDYLDAGMDQLINGDMDHRSPLLLAVARNDPDIVDLILNISHIDVNKCDIQGWTPLHEACCIGNPKIVKLLVDRPEITINCLYNDVFLNRINNWTPLHEACSGGHLEVVRMLISHPTCNVNSAYNDNSPVKKFATPLMVALEREREDVIECLLQHPNIDVEYANELGQTILHEACAVGNSEVVKMLLSKPGIIVRATNDEGQTPFDLAVANGQYHVVGMLGVMSNPSSTKSPVPENNELQFAVLRHVFSSEVGVTG
eukprot:TRINITY_DN18615_c0_g1_i1.p1 TRINITY_DN18615_c0_g1~~TRINITY_DN18615_c0_g1_i1.p1  ORF type:complete len:360 (+),score=74.06 TRINITY_DN18615_c0_g1_i1:48-1082(+)